MTTCDLCPQPTLYIHRDGRSLCETCAKKVWEQESEQAARREVLKRVGRNLLTTVISWVLIYLAWRLSK